MAICILSIIVQKITLIDRSAYSLGMNRPESADGAHVMMSSWQSCVVSVSSGGRGDDALAARV